MGQLSFVSAKPRAAGGIDAVPQQHRLREPFQQDRADVLRTGSEAGMSPIGSLPTMTASGSPGVPFSITA
jgi:hypothetical protein